VADVRALFEAELRRRGLAFSIDEESGRHAIEVDGMRMLVSLENVERAFARDGDPARIARFLDTIIASANARASAYDPAGLYWCLEPSDHVDKAEIRASVSDQVDRVLCHWSEDDNLISWVGSSDLQSLKLDAVSAGKRAFENLAAALRAAKVTFNEIDGVRLGMVGSKLPFKAALILAPNARELLGKDLGWPLLAVVPDREFLYLWAAKDEDFAARVGGVVVREYGNAEYPVSTEVFRIDDDGVRAIGEFPRKTD
jgi:hypothetical protein